MDFCKLVFEQELAPGDVVVIRRKGFQGMEQDAEIKGFGNHYTTQFRQYDPRLGRWFSRGAFV